MSTQLLEQHAPWSLSKSDLAAKCPFAFFLRYRDRAEREEGTYAKIGTAAHKVQELLLEKHMAPRDALAEAFALYPNLTSKEQSEVTLLLPSMQSFYERMQKYKVKHKVVEEFFEQEWAINASFEVVPYNDPSALFRGIVDYAMITESRYLLIVDHKSGRDRGIPYYAKQLDAYAVLGLANKTDVQGVQAALHYMKTQTLSWHDMRLAPDIRRMLNPWLKNLLTQRAGLLAAETPKVSNLCNWCDYLHHCEAGNNHLIQIGKRKTPKKPKTVTT